MNNARRRAKTRKPVRRIWAQHRRSLLIGRDDVNAEAWISLPASRKYPKRLINAISKGPCMALTLRASEYRQTFVGPLKHNDKSYPLTNWARKRAVSAAYHRYIKRRIYETRGAPTLPLSLN